MGSIVEQLGLGKYANGNGEAPPAAAAEEQQAAPRTEAPPESPPETEKAAAPVPPTQPVRKKRAKKKAGRKPAIAKQINEGSALGTLSSQLAEIHKEAEETEQFNANKAALRSAKAQLTQLKKFAGVVASTVEAVEKRIAELEEKTKLKTDDE